MPHDAQPLSIEYERPPRRPRNATAILIIAGTAGGGVTVASGYLFGWLVFPIGISCGLLVGFLCAMSVRSHMILAGIFGNLIAAAVCIAFVMIRSLIDHHSTNVWGMNVWETFAPSGLLGCKFSVACSSCHGGREKGLGIRAKIDLSQLSFCPRCRGQPQFRGQTGEDFAVVFHPLRFGGTDH